MKTKTAIAALAVTALLAAGCGEFGADDQEGIGDAPVDQQPDQTVKVWPNGDRFPNIALICAGPNGVYSTTREAPPVVVVNDPNCE